MAVLAIVASSLFLTYWLNPGRVIWTKDGTVTAAHQYSDPSTGTNWNVLIYIYQQTEMGYLINTGYVALNGPGTSDHGNYCWDDGHGNCLGTPRSFNVNQTVTIEALNNGNFMLRNRQL